MKKLISFFQKPYTGRLGRLQYFIGFPIGFISIIVGIALTTAVKSVFAVSEGNVIVIIVGVVFLVLSFLLLFFSVFVTWSLSVRRWHDLGCSGWTFLLNAIPIVGELLIVILFFIPSKEEVNEYGKQLKSNNIFSILFNKKTDQPFSPSEKYLPMVAFIGSLLVFLWFFLIHLR